MIRQPPISTRTNTPFPYTPLFRSLFTLSELEVAGRDKAWNIRQAVIAASHASYRYTATLGDKNKAKNDDSGLKSLAIAGDDATALRSEEHTSELQSLMRTSYAVFCLQNKTSEK